MTVTIGSRTNLESVLLDFARERRGILALRDQILDQRRGNLAVGPHRHRHRKLGVAPDDDVDGVAGADDVVVVRRGRR